MGTGRCPRRSGSPWSPATRWSTRTPTRRSGPGLEVAQVVGEVVDAAEVLDDDALDAQVVAPDLLDQLGVVAALDEDPAGAGDPGPRVVHRDRARRRTGRAARARPRARARREDDRPALEQEARAEREGAALAAPVLQGQRVEVAVDGDDLAAPVGGDLLDDRADLGRRLDGAAALRARASRWRGRRCRSGRRMPIDARRRAPTAGRSTRRASVGGVAGPSSVVVLGRRRRRPSARSCPPRAAPPGSSWPASSSGRGARPAGCPRWAGGPRAAARRRCRGPRARRWSSLMTARYPPPGAVRRGAAASGCGGGARSPGGRRARARSRGYGHSPAASASSTGTPRRGQVADRLGDDADRVALVLARTPGRRARRARARRPSPTWHQAEHDVEGERPLQRPASRRRSRTAAPSDSSTRSPASSTSASGTRTTRSPAVCPRPGWTSSTSRSPRSSCHRGGERAVGRHDRRWPAPRRGAGRRGVRPSYSP